MILSNFRLNIVLRIAFLGLSITGLLFAFFKTNWIVTPAILFIIIALEVYELLYYVETTNREFANFLMSIKSSDFSKYSLGDKRGKSFSFLKSAFNIIVEEFQLTRSTNEANNMFLQTVVENINTAVIAFDDSGDIKLINDSAKVLLHLPHLKNIHSLRQIDPKLWEYITDLSSWNHVLETNINGEKLKLSIRSSDFKILGIEHKLVSIQNIKTEIEHTELEAWSQLLHVLTHEIMNSITPLSSLSSTLKKKTETLLDKKEFDVEAFNDLSGGLNVIANRSTGLMNFVNQYKSIVTLPVPNFKVIVVKELFERISRFKDDELKEKGIELKLKISDDTLSVKIDSDLIEQVVINLINNACDALEQTVSACIELSADIINGKPIIRVYDNGPGIDKDIVSKIFIPFFTTKKNGSGIGLSLSKQIMRMHTGSINVSSIPNKGTFFSLEFSNQSLATNSN